MVGELARVTKLAALVDCSWAIQLTLPGLAPTSAASPAEQFAPVIAPYDTVIVDPAESVTPDTVMSCPETATVPVEDAVHPAAFDTVGAVHPAGTATLTTPFDIAPVPAVYVKATLCEEPKATLDVVVVKVPLPLAAFTTIAGELERLVMVPVDVDISLVSQVCVPVVDVTVAPGTRIADP
jgi:hypothetical protein